MRDIDTVAVVNGLKVLDPKRPIREADILVSYCSGQAEGDCQIFCVRPVIRHEFTKRSLNMTANCVFASAHSRGGRFHSAAAWFKTKYSSFVAASSEGKCPLVLTARRSLEFSASMAFVV